MIIRKKLNNTIVPNLFKFIEDNNLTLEIIDYGDYFEVKLVDCTSRIGECLSVTSNNEMVALKYLADKISDGWINNNGSEILVPTI